MAADLKEIYISSTVELAQCALERLEHKYNSAYPLIAKSWRANWRRVIPLFDYPPEIRKVIYDKRHRIAEYEFAQGHQDQGGLPP